MESDALRLHLDRLHDLGRAAILGKSIEGIGTHLFHHLFNYLLTDESVVVEIGGFCGDFVEELLTHANCNVWLYEPDQDFWEACCVRFRRYPKVHIFQHGIGDCTETVQFIKERENSSAVHAGLKGEHKTIQLYDIRGIVEELPEEIDLLNCNCEGGEYKIFPRLIDTGQIKQFKNIQIQFHNFAPGARMAHAKIQDALSETHEQVFDYPWLWEGWRKKEK